MPTPLSRKHQNALRQRTIEFLEEHDCHCSPKTYLPLELARGLKGNPMEGLLVGNVPTTLSRTGTLGIRFITQMTRGSAAAKIPNYAWAMKRWRIPGVMIAEGTAGEDLDGWVDWARREAVDRNKLLYAGDLDGFRAFFRKRLEQMTWEQIRMFP